MTFPRVIESFPDEDYKKLGVKLFAADQTSNRIGLNINTNLR